MARKTKRQAVTHYHAYIDLATNCPVVEAIPGASGSDGRIRLAREPQQCREADGRYLPKVFVVHSPESALDDLCRQVRLKLHECRTQATRLEEQLAHIVDLAQEMAARDAEESEA